MENNLTEYLDYIFKSFQGCRVGQGGFFPRSWINDRSTPQSFKMHVFDIVNVLIQNGHIYTDDPSPLPFLKLTQLGYDYMQGGDLELSKLDLSKLIDLNKSKEEIYESLWLYIGKEDEAPFYLKGPEFYNTIASFVGLTSYTYSQFTKKCLEDGKSASRTSFFRELFMMIVPEQIEGFLSDLSKTIIRVYQPLFRAEPEEEETDILSLVESAYPADSIREIQVVVEESAKTISTQPTPRQKIIFISYTWETKMTPGHKEWVRKLADNLTAKDFDVRLDQYQPFGTEMNHFMVTSVRDAERILLICTPEFKRCSDDMDRACGFEASLISNELIRDITSTKFLPIVRIGEPEEVMPDYLGNRNALVWHEADDDAFKLNELVSDLRRSAGTQ